MFDWNEPRITYLRSAVARTTFYEDLAQRMAHLLPDAKTVCDAGCGPGFLSFAMSRHFPRIFAADRSEEAVRFLQNELTRQGIQNVTAACCDLSAYTPEQPFDAMVFCLFGAMEACLAIGRRCCRGKLLIVKRNDSRHRFSLTEQPLAGESADDAAALLDRRGIPCTREDFSPELGQPLKSLDDAMDFFLSYSRDDPAALTYDAVRARLRQTGDPEFPYYLPQARPLSLFVIDTEELCHEETV